MNEQVLDLEGLDEPVRTARIHAEDLSRRVLSSLDLKLGSLKFFLG